MNTTASLRTRVLLTGGPGTGKTTLIEELSARGYACYPEEIRILTQELLGNARAPEGAENPLLIAPDSLEFNRKLLERRLRQWMEFDTGSARLSFYDRGIPDVLAYMDAFEQPYPKDFERAASDHPYDLVFYTPVWPDIYRQDSERLESIGLAFEMERALLKMYRQLGYQPVAIPFAGPGERADFVLHNLERDGLLAL